MHQFGAVVQNLPEVIEAVKKEVADRGMHLLRGKLIGVESFDTGFPRVAWVAGEENNWREFLEFAQNLGVKAVVYDFEKLDMETLREEAEDAVMEDEFSDTWQNVASALNTLEPHDGEIGHLGLMFQHGHMIYQASVKTAWFEDYMMMQETIRAFEDFLEDDGDMYDIQ